MTGSCSLSSCGPPLYAAGDTWQVPVKSTLFNGEPDNLQTDTITLTLKNLITDADSAAVLKASVTPASNDLEAAGGYATIVVPAATTKTILPGSYFWDIRRKTVAGDVHTIDSYASSGNWTVASPVLQTP